MGRGRDREDLVRVTARPSFRSLLADRVPGIVPSPVYADLDF